MAKNSLLIIALLLIVYIGSYLCLTRFVLSEPIDTMFPNIDGNVYWGFGGTVVINYNGKTTALIDWEDSFFLAVYFPLIQIDQRHTKYRHFSLRFKIYD